MSQPNFDVNEFIDSVKDDNQENDNVISQPPKEYKTELYKKWFKSKSQSGFLSIKPWFEGMKFKIDIGKTSSEGKLLSSTNVYVDAMDFAAYLNAIVFGTASTIYSANEKLGLPSGESFASFGGADINGKPVSRIFKSHYWQNGDSFDSNAFVWKCGHFGARKSETGAFIPDYKSPLSVDFLKVSKQEICSISYLLNISLFGYVSNNPNWYDQ